MPSLCAAPDKHVPPPFIYQIHEEDRMIGFVLPGGEFEYDARGLLMSFFPGEEFIMNPPEGEADMTIALPEIPGEGDKNKRKNIFKRRLYDKLSGMTGRTLPWGTLTGIRPVRIVSDLLKAGYSPEEAAAIFSCEYYVSPEKTALSVDIAMRERTALAGMNLNSGYSLYVGIPFCPTRCLYCSFTSYPAGAWQGRMEDYLDCLFREIEWTAGRFSSPPDTVYIGGGTPTALPPALLDRLLDRLCSSFDLGRGQEFTVEAGRPDSIDAEKLDVLRKYPVNRISVNPQTMSQATLDRIGRRHTVSDTIDAYLLARDKGFDNINMDIIIGLPGEGTAEVADTLRRIEELSPDSLTVHAVAVKRASRLKMEAKGKVTAGGTQAELEEMMKEASASAASIGLKPYYLYRQKNTAGNLENVGYAREGKLCLYNIVNMEEVQTVVALGAGTVTKAVWQDGRIERCDNVKDIILYMGSIEGQIARKEKLLCGVRNITV
jgi:oxygen-independent coproporphyrinogen-3 oxidase